MKKLTLMLVLLILPVFTFAAISEQDKLNFQHTYSNGEITPETYTKLFNFCDKNGTNIESCLSKLKVQASALTQNHIKNRICKNHIKNRICCVNISGFVGEYAYIHGQEYCIPPC